MRVIATGKPVARCLVTLRQLTSLSLGRQEISTNLAMLAGEPVSSRRRIVIYDKGWPAPAGNPLGHSASAVPVPKRFLMADNKSFGISPDGSALAQGSDGVVGGHAHGGPETTRRDFMVLASSAMAAVGVAGVGWAFIDSMNPAADTLGHVVDRRRSEADCLRAANHRGLAGQASLHRSADTRSNPRWPTQVDVATLRDPQTDASARSRKPEWLIVIGICTHLGCIPLGQKADRSTW